MRKTRYLIWLVVICLLGTLTVPFSAAADSIVNVVFNPLDSTARQDMEPATNTSIKDQSLSSNYLEGTGAVKFGYKQDYSGLYYYGRTPEAYASTGLDITGAEFMTFDIFVSDVTGWSLTDNCLIGLRSLASSQGTGQWDTSCGQVKGADLYEAFTDLKQGWNRVVLPIDTSVATQSVIWGYRIQFPASSAKAGFYIIMDDVRFVNQAYLDSDECAKVNAYKDVAMQIASLPMAAEITAAHKTAVQEARAAYEALNEEGKAMVVNYVVLQVAEAALANAGQKLDLLVDGLNSNSLVILPGGNTGTNYPKGAIVSTDYTEGDGSLFSNWPEPESGTLAGTQNGINISLVGIGGSAGLDISTANYIAFDMYVHGFKMTEGKTAYVGFGSEAKWQSYDLGSVYFTEQMAAATEGWNHFVLPIDINATAVKNIRLAVDNSCTAVTLTAEDAYVLLDDVRLLNEEGKAVDAVRTQAKAAISAIARAHHSCEITDIKAARAAYDALNDSAKEYVYNLALLNAAESSVNISFHTMDSTAELANEGYVSRTVSTEYQQGTGAVKFEFTQEKTGGLFWYIYCDRTAYPNGMDMSGTDYITFDFYVSDVSQWTLSGDTRINIGNSASGWNGNSGQVTATDMNNIFKALKNGWNRVEFPIDHSSATDTMVYKLRMYFSTGSAPAGFYTMIDDVCFVSGAYLKSQQYADTLVAKDVTLQISKLNASSTSATVYAVQSAYLALTDDQKKLVSNFNHLNAMIQNVSSTPVNISFRNLDNADRTAQEAATSTETTNVRVEGTGAAKFEHAADRTGGLFWYTYCETAVDSTGVNITGATYVIFDFFVSDPELWDIGTGDMRFSVRKKGSAGWDNSCTQVSAANMKAAFSNVKQGWNHIVMPLESLLTTDAWAFRMYMASGSAKQGFYTIMDDIRFVNSAYLASAEYADKTAAKDVAGMISQLTKDSAHAQLTAARTAYNGLTETQRTYVCNYDWLTTFEAGGTLPGDAPQTFQTIPANHLGELADFEKGAFSLAFLSDLHYAVNWNSQQKQVYLDSMQYILDRAEDENTLMTLQLGDLTSSNKLAQWQTVREGFQMLVDGNMPYATAIGNHDIGGGANAAYNTFLPYDEQVSENPYLAGAKEVGKTDNLYYTFEVNGVKYMVLTLACYPKDDVLTWADGVVKAHADHNVIMITHSYLQMRNGTLGYTEETEALAAGFKGIDVWNKLIKTNPNIFMTFSAHNSYPVSGQNGVGLFTAQNDAGKNVYQFLVPDPQGYENTYGGLGSLFMLRFGHDGRTVTGEYIATRYNKDFIGYGDNTFELEVDLIADQEVLDKNAAKAVEEKIAALQVESLDDKADVEAAQAAYNALTDTQKDLVTNLQKLTDAVAAIALLQEAADKEAADRAAAKAVEEKIAALQVESLDDKADVEAAREAYEALSEQQKGLVTNLEALQQAEEAIVQLEQMPVIAFGDVNGDDEIDAKDALLILQAAVDKAELTPEQEGKADVNGDDEIDAKDALLVLQKAVDKIDRFPVEEQSE